MLTRLAFGFEQKNILVRRQFGSDRYTGNPRPDYDYITMTIRVHN